MTGLPRPLHTAPGAKKVARSRTLITSVFDQPLEARRIKPVNSTTTQHRLRPTMVLLRKSGEHLLKQEVFYGARNQVYDGVQARGGAPENGGDKLVHGSGGISQPRAE